MIDSDKLPLISDKLITEATQDYYMETAVEHLRTSINWRHKPASADKHVLERLPFDFASKIKQTKKFDTARGAMENLIRQNFKLPANFQFENKLLKDSAAAEEAAEVQSSSQNLEVFAETVFAALAKIEANVIANYNLMMAALLEKGFSAAEIDRLKQQRAEDCEAMEFTISEIYSEKLKGTKQVKSIRKIRLK